MFFQNYNALITAAFFFILSFIFWIQYHKKRINFIDFKTIRTFKLDEKVFFNSLNATYTKTVADNLLSIFGKPTIESRKEWFIAQNQRTDTDLFSPNERPLYYEFLKPAVPLTALVLIGVFVDSQYRQKIQANDLILALGQNRKMVSSNTKSPVIIENKAPIIKVEDPKPVESTVAQTKSDETPSDNNTIDKAPASVTEKSEMILAVESGNMRKVIQLLGQGNNVRTPDPHLKGMTPILMALKLGDLEMAYLLLSIGSNLNEVDFDGKGSLFYAVEGERKVETATYVLRGQIDVNKKLADGKTVLDIAKSNGWNDVIPLLEAAGAKTGDNVASDNAATQNTSQKK